MAAPLMARPTATGIAPSGSGLLSRRRSIIATMGRAYAARTRRPELAAGLPADGSGARGRLERVRHAVLVVLGDGQLLGVDGAGRAGVVAPDLVLPEALLQGVVGEQA